MYIGPLGWPPLRVWVSATVVLVVVILLCALTGSAIPFGIAVFVVLVLGARAQVARFRGMGGLPDPPEREDEQES